jgi:ribosomal protein S13
VLANVDLGTTNVLGCRKSLQALEETLKRLKAVQALRMQNSRLHLHLNGQSMRNAMRATRDETSDNF